ncbi:MAG: hypothetical protein MK008_02500 [Bdellovibrionales bacterium]|nr:hypothetical protein [Bdellovibrionales bacterium]
MKKYNALTVLCFSFCGLQLNQAAVLPMSIVIKQETQKTLDKQNIAKVKNINFNCRLNLNNSNLSEKLWKNKKQLNFHFVSGISTKLNNYRNSYNFEKYLPHSNSQITSEKIVEKVGLGYLEDVFSLREFKDSVERVQPSFSKSSSDSSIGFKIDTFQTQASATYKSSFEAKVVLDFNIKNSEVVFSKPISKNTSLSFNLQNTDVDSRQTVNLALAW